MVDTNTLRKYQKQDQKTKLSMGERECTTFFIVPVIRKEVLYKKGVRLKATLGSATSRKGITAENARIEEFMGKNSL